MKVSNNRIRFTNTNKDMPELPLARSWRQEDKIPKYHKKSTTSTVSDSEKRANHRHHYKKVILYFGAALVVWGRQCEDCGRVDSTYKPTAWNTKDFTFDTGKWSEWGEEDFLAAIHRKYPAYSILLLHGINWTEWKSETHTDQ